MHIFVSSCLHGLRSIASHSWIVVTDRQSIDSKNVLGTPASGDAANTDVPSRLHSSYVRSIAARALLITGCAQTVCTSIRLAGSILIMLLINANSSGLLSRSIWLKSSWRSRCHPSPLHNQKV